MRTKILVAIAFLFVGALLLRAAPAAHAGLLGDLWQNYLAPLIRLPELPWSRTPPSAPAPRDAERERSVPLYQPVIDYERAVVDAVKRASPAVVSITVSKNVPIIERCPVNPFPNLPPGFRDFLGDRFQYFGQCERGTRLEEVGGGSGFIVSADGMVVTNRHVVLDAKAEYTVFTNDGRKYDARVLARDPSQDLAILKIDATGLAEVTLGDSDSVDLGQTAIAIGNALAEFRNTVSVGVISGLARNVTAGGAGVVETIQGVLQTDAAINPGNSGGPLLNLRGEVIGINTAIVSGAQNIGFAIPINRAKRAIESVKTGGEIVVPYLGVRYIAITEAFAREQGLKVSSGALVRGSEEGPGVVPDSPAAAAGIRAEDIILEVDGARVDADHPLGSLIAERRAGDTVTLRILRAGEERTLRATLGKRPSE